MFFRMVCHVWLNCKELKHFWLNKKLISDEAMILLQQRNTVGRSIKNIASLYQCFDSLLCCTHKLSVYSSYKWQHIYYLYPEYSEVTYHSRSTRTYCSLHEFALICCNTLLVKWFFFSCVGEKVYSLWEKKYADDRPMYDQQIHTWYMKYV